MRLKCLQELVQHFFLCLLAGSDVWMLPSVVAFPHIFDINIAVLIKIKFQEYALHQVLPERTHVSLDSAKQLIE